MDLKTKVEKYCLQNKIFSERDKILIGVSGGSDSIALLDILYHLRPKYKFTILVAHINYNLRGEESDGDEEFVKKYKEQSGIIGHFGLGFYSSFMVAEKVEIVTKK